MKELVGKLRRVDVVPCKKFDFEKAFKKCQKDTLEATSKLFLLELKRLDKLNKFTKSKKYSDFIKFVNSESKKLVDKINKKAASIMDDEILIEIVAETIYPKLSLKRTDNIVFPSIAPHDLTDGSQKFCDCSGEENESWNKIDRKRDMKEINLGNKDKIGRIEVKSETAVLKENVKKIKKITKKEDEV